MVTKGLAMVAAVNLANVDLAAVHLATVNMFTVELVAKGLSTVEQIAIDPAAVVLWVQLP